MPLASPMPRPIKASPTTRMSRPAIAGNPVIWLRARSAEDALGLEAPAGDGPSAAGMKIQAST